MPNVKDLTLQQVIDFIKTYTEWYEAKYPATADGGPGGDTPPPPPKP